MTDLYRSQQELGLGYSNPEVIQQALSAGRQGNVLQRFHERYVEKNGHVVLELNLTVSRMRCGVWWRKNVAPELSCGDWSGRGRTFSITPRQDGVSVRVEDTV
ncbi:MAG: peptidoglycan binding domain-containing protein [Eisenbergiella sp.]